MKYNFHNIQGLNKQSDFLTSSQKMKIEKELDSAYEKIRGLVKENKDLKTKVEQKTISYKESIDYNRKIVAILAHDLRSPFNSIMGFLEMLKVDQEMDQATRNNYIEIISSVGNNALEMLDLLLYWVVNRNENKMFEPIMVNLHEQVEDALLLIRPLAKDKNIVVENQVPSNLVIKADSNILKSVIRNLSSNSVKFTESNGRIIILANRYNNIVEISVTDNGIGFDSKYLDSLLENENYESNESVEDRWKGLGLMLCKDFIQIHGGIMTIHSESQTGTVVKFTLPQDL